jgi:hypothetical protein
VKYWMTAVMAAGYISSGCHRGPDTGNNVRKALDQANMQRVSVKVDGEGDTKPCLREPLAEAARPREQVHGHGHVQGLDPGGLGQLLRPEVGR